MTPATRKTLVRQWQRFARAIEETYPLDEAQSVETVGDTLNATATINRINRTRATYLAGLVEAGLLKVTDSVPSDDLLWEMHPINVETGGFYD